MACCCGPQVCLCTTPENSVKASQVLAEFSDFSGGENAREVWRDFATNDVPDFLNGLAIYTSILDPQPAGTPSSQVVYGFSASYDDGPCTLMNLSIFMPFECAGGNAAQQNVDINFQFRKDSDPQTIPGNPVSIIVARCGLGTTGSVERGSNTPGNTPILVDCNVCTKAAGALNSTSIEYRIGLGGTFDTVFYTGNVKLTPL